MIDRDWQDILVTGAGISVLAFIGIFLLIGACLIIGKEIARKHDEQAEEAMASMPDHALIDAILQFEEH